MIEVHDVIVHGVRRDDQVADVLRVRRHLEAQRVLDRAHRGDRVHRRAHPAEPLGEEPRVPGIAAEEDALDAAEHLARRPRLGDDAAVHLDVDAQMAFDARDGIDGNVAAHPGTPALSTRPMSGGLRGWIGAGRPPRIGNCLTRTT